MTRPGLLEARLFRQETVQLSADVEVVELMSQGDEPEHLCDERVERGSGRAQDSCPVGGLQANDRRVCVFEPDLDIARAGGDLQAIDHEGAVKHPLDIRLRILEGNADSVRVAAVVGRGRCEESGLSGQLQGDRGRDGSHGYTLQVIQSLHTL